MKELYLLSGLGADKRVYDFLDLRDYKVHHIDWIAHHDHETLEDYAGRLAQQIQAPNPILMGVSFGGMIAVEIAKQRAVEKVILISSAKTRDDIPTQFSFFKPLRLHRFIPARALRHPNALVFWFFGVDKTYEKDLLRAIMRDTDVVFFRWAIGKIVNWKNETILPHAIHIHGTNDRLIPFTTADYRIEGGGHLMIINRAKEIDALVKEII
ncbi:alpha/beta hydrolase [Chryseolinea lacunae]|uniref:Alpha/beta hydrolase n=1 Tax=Chryseolinea lacunae TaxID=2801331 RepID=A0ABS1KSN6_9BACT|nr:alpha/beta hydrolase [Chryseolinea lacunae]MBL0742488.1 alpha/beta hydrolase [Chryseolinea lacunae]